MLATPFSALVFICATSVDTCAIIGAENAYPTFDDCTQHLEEVVDVSVGLFNIAVPDVEYEIRQSWCTTDVDAPPPINS